MSKGTIRLQYSGFVIFMAKMMSVVSGLIFQLMIARSTTELEYDVWFNLNDVLVYFTLLATALPFWSMRSVARRKEAAAKTGVVANLIISAIAATIYIPLVPLITSSLGIGTEHLLLYYVVSMQIVELYSVHALQFSLRATKPQAIGYGLLLTEICKVALGYVLIVELNEPLLGGLLSLIVAFTIQIAYYLKLIAPELKLKVRWDYIREWLKGSLVNIYNVVGNQIANFIFIMLFVYGGEGARGRHGLARQVSMVITYSSSLALALIPKLISDRKREDITTSLKMVLMFAIPMCVGAIVMSDSYLIIMKSQYTDASPVLIILSIDALVFTISTLFTFVLFGVEEVDRHTKISFRELAKSRLLVAFSLPYIHSAITLPTAFIVLTNYTYNQPLLAAVYASAINMLARLAMMIVLYFVLRRIGSIDIPWKSISKYVLASAVMAIVLFVIPNPTRISSTLILTGIGGTIYIGSLLAIDRESRELIFSAWNEITARLRR